MNLEDIAKQAGVSRSTVSRVINNEPHVSDKTRIKVMEVIERVSFRPNPAARALVTQRTQVIGVVIPQMFDVFFGDNSYYPQLLQGTSEAINELDHNMLMWFQHRDENRDHFGYRVAKNRLADGFVLCSMAMDDPVLLQLHQAGKLFVMVERPAEHLIDKISHVTVDNVQAAQVAVRHLIQLGRRRIAHITGELTISDGQDRLQGYKLALEEAGLAVNPELIGYGMFSYEHGYKEMKNVLRHKPDAVFAGCDLVGLGVLHAIQEAGLRVPDDISLIAFDDLDIATKAAPQFTTIRQPIQEKGAYAARLLIDMIEGNNTAPQQVILPTQLVIRQSCGAMFKEVVN